MPESAAVAEVTTTSTPASPAPSSTPSVPSTASTAAPATSAATPASPAGERLSPKSTRKDISNFLRALDTPDAASSSTSPVAQPEAATTAQAQEPVKAGEVPNTLKAEPPKEAWPTILENARTKAVEGFRTQYGITPQVTPEVFQKGIGFARAINENPIAFLNKLSADIANHPIWGPQLRSSAGRTLATPAPSRPDADIEVRNEQGQVVGRSYSDAQTMKLLEWERAEMKGEFTQMIQPFQQDREQRQNEAQQAAFQKEVDAGAESEQARVNEILEGRKELGPKVAELMAQGVHHIDAALQVRKQFIVPTAAKAAEQAVLDTQLKKVAGNTVNGSGPTAPKAKIGPGSTQKELAAFLRESAEASA